MRAPYAPCLAIALAGTAGCLRDTTFHCTTDDDCSLSATIGICEPEGFCSTPDRNCASGRAFNDFSGSLSRHCVSPPDAGSDSGRCAPAFEPLLGAPGHVYYLLTTGAGFAAQETICEAQGPASYLAIPDTASELRAVLDFGGQPAIWLGITDRVSEGTFLTLRGAAPVLLPWATGEPDDKAPGEDCVSGIDADATIKDDRCDLTQLAVCECDP